MAVDVAQLVTLQRSVARDPRTIYCFPGAGDSVTCFLSLADSLGTGFTVHGVQPRGLDGTSTPHSSVEEAVSDNIEALRSIHPGGPYRLLGHSFGGWIAFEMALRLTAEGEELDTLVLLDTDPPASSSGKIHGVTPLDALMELIRNLEDKAARSLSLDRAALESVAHDARLHQLMHAMKTAGLFPPAAALPSIASMVEVFEANLYTCYVPARALAGDMLLVHPAVEGLNGGGYVAGEDAARAWRAFARNVQRRVVPGTHMRMLTDPDVRRIADGVRSVWTG